MPEKCAELAKQCEKFKENVMDFIDNELDQETLIELENHLGLCVDCESFVDVYKKMLRASGNLKNKTFVTPEIRNRLKHALAQKYCKESE